jgi:hypothetical protein
VTELGEKTRSRSARLGAPITSAHRAPQARLPPLVSGTGTIAPLRSTVPSAVVADTPLLDDLRRFVAYRSNRSAMRRAVTAAGRFEPGTSR